MQTPRSSSATMPATLKIFLKTRPSDQLVPMNRTVVRNVAIIADYKVFIGCEHDFTLRRWTSGNVRIGLIQSSAVHHDATGPDGDSFARQTDHPFQQHEPAFIELDGDHIAAFRSVPAESEAVNE